MKVQQVSNKQQSFGMALKVKRSAMEQIIKHGRKDIFERVLPELKEAAKTADITVRGGLICRPHLRFTATPLNKLKINNAITREFYESSKKSGYSILSLENESTFVTHANAAKQNLEKAIEKKKTDAQVKKEANSFIKKLQEQM